MKKALPVVLILLFCSCINAQLLQNGNPFSWNLDLGIPSSGFKCPKIDNEVSIAKYDQESIEKSYRFGEELTVELDILKSAEVNKLDDESTLYRYRISSPGAISLNFIFSAFHLEKGSLMYIYDAEQKSFTGAYSFLNNNRENVLGTDILKSDNVIIEIFEPKYNHGTSKVILSGIIHGFRDVDSYFAKAFGGSGSCNYDVNCPLGNGFEDQKNGVALTISGGLACSGSLVNNTSGTIIPYYLTARHCGVSTSTWVLRFNWERTAANAICAQSNSTDNNGITTNIITGTELKASSNISDFTLVKLNSIPDNSWNVFYNGWDNSDQETVNEATVIHHPKQDIKKISKALLSPYKTEVNFNGASDCQVWRIDQWTYGTTEQGSSGSPLFDQNKRIIGALTGGSASCSGMNPGSGYDLFGRFGYSWATLSDSSLQLKYWLDPGNTGAVYVDGIYQNPGASVLDLALTNVQWLTSEICDVIQPYLIIYNNGNVNVTSARIRYKFNGNEQIIDWTGNLAQYQSDTIFFPFPSLSGGSVTFEAEITEVNGGVDNSVSNNLLSSVFNYSEFDEYVNIEFGYDFYTSETSWKIVDAANVAIVWDQRNYVANGVHSPFMYSKCLPVGCYKLLLSDSGGDGWTSFDRASGYLKIRDNAGAILKELDSGDANFGSEIAIDFCISSLSVDKISENEFQVFPNPSKESLNIKSIGSNLIYDLKIYSINGQLVKNLSFINGSLNVYFSHQLEKGIYLINISTEKGNIVKKIVVE